MTFTACMPFEKLTLYVREDGSVDVIVEDDHYNTTIPLVDALALADAIRRAADYEHLTTAEPDPERP